MDDMEPQLTDADRRAIADIRRKLDAEFREKLDAELEASDDVDRARRRRVWATFLFGVLAGTGLGVMGAVFWERYAERESAPSETRVLAEDLEPRRDAAAVPWVAVDHVALLHDALEEWIEATRRGDIAAQMRFYPERVPVYYTWRDAPREAVRAEKIKVFGAASRLVITTDVPAVELADDGLTAVTRFRKQYVIEGPVIRRRGEVLQELRWTRTSDGWVIVGERDARVLRSG